MMIAMKSYFFFPLFFLYILSLPLSAFSQENSIEQSRAKLQTVPSSPDTLPADHQEGSDFKYDIEPENIPQRWENHAMRESDTFQTKFLNMLFILALLIGFMILASWALKRLMRSKMTQLNTNSDMKIIETRYLSPRATLYLVEVQNQAFLIAESPTAITYLATLSLEGGGDSTVSSATAQPPPFPR
jgi:flagellar protein FliO/FliZ